MHLGRLRREGVGYLGERVRSQLRWRLERLRARREPQVRDLSPAEFRSEQVKDAFYAALPHYRMGVYPGKVVLFRPSHDGWIGIGDGFVTNPHNRGQIADDENRFRAHVAGPLEVHVVTGDHDAMVLEPHVRELAAQLRRSLDEAMREKTSTAEA
jgi:thioesterase domain-containing protein